jgi:uncharacterized protein (TIGR00730 family)
MTAARHSRRRTGDPALDRRLMELLDGRVESPEDRDLLFEMLTTIVRLAGDGVDRLSLKITNAALKEMRQAFRVFAPYRDVPKVTIFGSARTRPDDPLYTQTRDLAAALARTGWMVVTGAGPGIMAAGAEGAGRDRSIGVNIRLPFEQEANPFIAADSKLVSMKYFFTRKLMLMKESAGFVVLPGGFGTLDETFELLTLLQTGKAAPAPLVLLEVPGGTYWQAWDRFVRDELAGRGLVSDEDLLLSRITDNVDDAASEILGFFRNYHSIRYVAATLVMRLRSEPTDEEVARLSAEFFDICVDDGIHKTGALPAEVADDDHVDLPRLAFRFDRMSHGRLRALIDAVNRLPTAPPPSTPDQGATAAAGTPPETGAGIGEGLESVPPDPAVAALLADAGAPGDDGRALEAVAELAALLATPSLPEGAAHRLAAELSHLVLASRSPQRRIALFEALEAAPPVVVLEPALDLLADHRPALSRAELARLLEVLDGAVARGNERGVRRPVAVLLRIEDPTPVLDELVASAGGDVAERAAALRARIDGLLDR